MIFYNFFAYFFVLFLYIYYRKRVSLHNKISFNKKEYRSFHNTDAHLRSSVIGRNVTIVAVDGEMDLGEFGRIHFIDWDQTRGRTRTVQVMIIGE